jgi:hypothetical protein
LFVVTTASAKAQFRIYGEFNATHEPTISTWYRGSTGGAYGNFLHADLLSIGLDLRGPYATGD